MLSVRTRTLPFVQAHSAEPGGQPLLTSLPRAAGVIAARRCSRLRAEALAAAGAQARAAGRVEQNAGWAAAAGRRWARARGQVRGRPSPWARPRLCKCPGRNPGSPPEVGRAPGSGQGGHGNARGTGLRCSQRQGCHLRPPGETEAAGRSASTWLWGPLADSIHAGWVRAPCAPRCPGSAAETLAFPAARAGRAGCDAARSPDGKRKLMQY